MAEPRATRRVTVEGGIGEPMLCPECAADLTVHNPDTRQVDHEPGCQRWAAQCEKNERLRATLARGRQASDLKRAERLAAMNAKSGTL